MAPGRETILVLEGDPASRQSLVELMNSAGYEVLSAASPGEGLAAVRRGGVDLLLFGADLSDAASGQALTDLRGSAATSSIPVILLLAGAATERTRGLDLGADDALSRPWEPAELLARVRAQLREKRALDDLREKTRLAEEGQEIAHTAFQALAVTEKMTRDAFSLERMLKIGVTAALLITGVMAAIFFLYRGRAEKETRRAYALIAQLEGGVAKQRDLVTASRRMREQLERSTPALPEQKAQLEKQSQELRARLAAPDAGDVAALRQQLAETRNRLRSIEDASRVAQGIIRSYAPSVCLLHVAVAFRDKDSRQTLRYAGINPQGEPLQDSEGNPIYTLTGRGPEVRGNFFGTGFLAATDGRILTNRHVVEPWWKNEELDALSKEGVEPVIAEINAYFPDAPRAYRVEIQKISPDADLAVVQGDLGELKRRVLALDESKEAAISGQPIVSVGYATGLAGILARAGQDAAESIVATTGGNPKQVMAELARRSLIRPITTQGHIGDVLADKIVYDAQTTSGGSGGPLFNHHGKVIGVTFAVVKNFGGSNFGIPIRYALPLLAR
jgi:DNA-binding response OmpR family regulator/S1-C subfamily serine protease